MSDVTSLYRLVFDIIWAKKTSEQNKCFCIMYEHIGVDIQEILRTTKIHNISLYDQCVGLQIQIHYWNFKAITIKFMTVIVFDAYCMDTSRLDKWANNSNNHNNKNECTAPSFFLKWWKYVMMSIYVG